MHWLFRGLSCQPNIYVSWSTSELIVRLAPWNRFKPSSKIFYWPFQGGTAFVDLWWFFFCLVFVMPLCASVYLCLVITCWEMADPWLSFMVSNCNFVTFLLVSWVRCGTWLYRSIPDLCTITYFLILQVFYPKIVACFLRLLHIFKWTSEYILSWKQTQWILIRLLPMYSLILIHIVCNTG